MRKNKPFVPFAQLVKKLDPHLIDLVPAKLQETYEKLGWFSTASPDIACPNNVNYSTWGFSDNYDHKDFQICFPVSYGTCHDIIHELANQIAEGARFEPGETYYDGILGGGYRLKFIEARDHGRYVLRLILPDPNHEYVGEIYQAQFTLLDHDGTPSCSCPACQNAGKMVHPCADCGIDTTKAGVYDNNYYMVKDRIWDKYGVGEGFLCLECLQKRLGRPFRPTDFNDSVLNDVVNEAVKKLKGLQ